jgi:hypothetical protein
VTDERPSAPVPDAAGLSPSDAVSPVMRGIGLGLLLAPILGTLVNIGLMLAGPPGWLRPYPVVPVMAVVGVLAVTDLFASYFHYRVTRMRMDVASRLLANVWLLSVFVVLWLTYKVG